MIRRPPRSTRTDTLFPYTTLFRSVRGAQHDRAQISGSPDLGRQQDLFQPLQAGPHLIAQRRDQVLWPLNPSSSEEGKRDLRALRVSRSGVVLERSDERRVGNECVSTLRARRTRYNKKKKKI